MWLHISTLPVKAIVDKLVVLCPQECTCRSFFSTKQLYVSRMKLWVQDSRLSPFLHPFSQFSRLTSIIESHFTEHLY